MSTRPTRRQFIASVPLAVAGALPAAAVVFPPGIQFPRHQAGFCCCRACCTRRLEQGAHPLRQAVAVAFYRARSAVEVLAEAHGLECYEVECDTCDAANYASFHLGLYGCLVEDGLAPDDAVSAAEAECNRTSKAARAGRFLLLPSAKRGNHPALMPAVDALKRLETALVAMLRGHGCGGCPACEDAGGVLGGIDRVESGLKSCAIPCW